MVGDERKLVLYIVPAARHRDTGRPAGLPEMAFREVRHGMMTAFPKAAVQNGGVRIDLNVRFWPEADVR